MEDSLTDFDGHVNQYIGRFSGDVAVMKSGTVRFNANLFLQLVFF